MKRTYIGLAVLAVCGVVSAQGSVTLFGVADTGVSNYHSDGGNSVTKMTTGGLASSRLGFRGDENLGGGMYASFWLEAGLNTDDGRGSASNTNNQASGAPAANLVGGQGLTFNRRATVSLRGNWGEVRLGRDYVPAFWNWSVFDPFGILGVAAIGNLVVVNTSAITNARASNSIGYFSPNCSTPRCQGFYGQLMYALGENASGAPTSSDGRHVGARVGYGNQRLALALATGHTKTLAVGDYRQSNFGASYDFGIVKPMIQYGVNTVGTRSGAVAGVKKASYYMLGATIPLGSGYVPVSLAHLRLDNASGATANQVGLGYVHNLSKRTALYGTYARITNKNSVAATPRIGVTGSTAVTTIDGSSRGIDIGIRHSF